MISKSTKSKRRAQARESALIQAALMAAVHPEAGTWENQGWLTCQALTEIEGIKEIPGEARYLSRFPRGSRERDYAATMTPAVICTALQHRTAANVLAQAGLL